jgi:predicted nucleic acid-binding Zn ribbon protein
MPAETIIFNGIKFRRYPEAKKKAHRRYYRPGISDAINGIQALHQEIWKAAHGPIPDGCLIHHRDENPLNNTLDNLVCVSPSEHGRAHAEHRTTEQILHLERIRPLAADWHASAAGRAWHSENGRRSWVGRTKFDCICTCCGGAFTAFTVDAKACSHNCEEKLRRRRQYTDRECVICGTVFHGGGRTCSSHCRAALIWRHRAGL